MRLGKEIASRKQSLTLLNFKLDAGFASIPEQTAMIRDLENTKVARASQREACTLPQQGTHSLLELEDARRQLSVSENNVIIAQRDQSLAWVRLVQASGMTANADPNIFNKS
jgi:hypothetical protein